MANGGVMNTVSVSNRALPMIRARLKLISIYLRLARQQWLRDHMMAAFLVLPMVLVLIWSMLPPAPMGRVELAIAPELPLVAQQLRLDRDQVTARSDVLHPTVWLDQGRHRMALVQPRVGALVLYGNAADRTVAEQLKQQLVLLPEVRQVELQLTEHRPWLLSLLPGLWVLGLFNLGWMSGRLWQQTRALASLRLLRRWPVPVWIELTAHMTCALGMAAVICAVFLLSTLWLSGSELPAGAWLMGGLALALLALCFLALGMAIAHLLRGQVLVWVLLMVNGLILIPGSDHSTFTALAPLQGLRYALPSTYGIDLLRGLMLGTEFAIAPAWSWLYLMLISAALWMCTWATLRRPWLARGPAW